MDDSIGEYQKCKNTKWWKVKSTRFKMWYRKIQGTNICILILTTASISNSHSNIIIIICLNKKWEHTHTHIQIQANIHVAYWYTPFHITRFLPCLHFLWSQEKRTYGEAGWGWRGRRVDDRALLTLCSSLDYDQFPWYWLPPWPWATLPPAFSMVRALCTMTYLPDHPPPPIPHQPGSPQLSPWDPTCSPVQSPFTFWPVENNMEEPGWLTKKVLF